MFYSLVIPVYNRPDHVTDLLESLTHQAHTDFEVIIVESGSSVTSEAAVAAFTDRLDVTYIPWKNEGQGFSRNRGMRDAKGEYLVIMDSDILVPPHYLEAVEAHLQHNFLDMYGGPDRLHPASTDVQKAVNFVMTSFLTTGGTRGGKSQVGQYYPRSFNMGISRAVYEKVGGFNIPFMGEDIEFSGRVLNAGYRSGLIEDAFVFHERKDSIEGFARQIHFFGRARINIARLVPGSFKVTHLIPIIYCVGFVLMLFGGWFAALSFLYMLYNALIALGAMIRHESVKVGLYALVLTNVLMFGYAWGTIQEFVRLYVLGREQTYTR